MSNEKEFNLTEEPWIRVVTPNCDTFEVSLTEALIRAHEFTELAGELPTQDAAILRLLLAVLHTVVSRNGPDGDDILIDEDNADEVWGELWEKGQFPEETIRAYLSYWYDRFWLFHPERPFYQVPDLEAGAKPKEAAKLNGEVSESAHKIRLFSPRTGEWKQAITYGEAARWLVHINNYDDANSIKNPSPKIGWLGKLGVVTVRGNNLFETLMLNMILLDHNEAPWGRNIPTWEAPLRREKELSLCSVPIPDNPAQLYTMQFRRMCLLADDGFVRQYKAASGDWFDDTAIRGGFRESMTAWRLAGDKTGKWHVPKKFSREVQIWREFSTMVSVRADAEKEPGTVQWCRWLVMNDLLPKDRLITFDTVVIEYDDMSSSITSIFSDRMSFHGSILTEAGAVWRVLIKREVDRCKEFADSVGKLAANLEKAAGHVERDGKGNLVPWYKMASADKAKEDYYYQIDVPFRAWLEKPDPDQDDTEREALRREWANKAKRIALRLGEELALRAGDTALVGRFIQEGKEKKHYSTPEAIRDFRIELNNISKKEGITW